MAGAGPAGAHRAGAGAMAHRQAEAGAVAGVVHPVGGGPGLAAVWQEGEAGAEAAGGQKARAAGGAFLPLPNPNSSHSHPPSAALVALGAQQAAATAAGGLAAAAEAAQESTAPLHLFPAAVVVAASEGARCLAGDLRRWLLTRIRKEGCGRWAQPLASASQQPGCTDCLPL